MCFPTVQIFLRKWISPFFDGSSFCHLCKMLVSADHCDAAKRRLQPLPAALCTVSAFLVRLGQQASVHDSNSLPFKRTAHPLPCLTLMLSFRKRCSNRSTQWPVRLQTKAAIWPGCQALSQHPTISAHCRRTPIAWVSETHKIAPIELHAYGDTCQEGGKFSQAVYLSWTVTLQPGCIL